MTDPTDSEHAADPHEGVDDIFSAAGRRPGGPRQDARAGAEAPDPDEPDPDPPITSAEAPYPDEPDADHPITSAEAPYADADRPITSAEAPYPDRPAGTPVASPDSFPGGPPPGQPAAPMPYAVAPPDRRPYPAGPGYPVQPAAYGRRPPITGPRPDADGYYPGDYYLAPDWMRIIVKGLASVVIILALVAGGSWLWDEYAPTDSDDEVVEEPTPTPVPLVSVFLCAGDPQPVSEMLAPSALLIAGRTADSRWLAFRNPDAPPEQLWIRAIAVPDFEPTSVGVVPCASAPNEFPTPARRPTPVPTIAATPTPLN